MAISLEALFAAMLAFQVKHALADFLLQPGYMWRNKGRYGHPGGLLHAGLHMLGSLPPLQLLGLPWWALIITLLAEGLLHYHIDWLKEKLNAGLNLTPTRSGFWYLVGLDQLLHQLTYLLIIVYWFLLW